MTQEILWEKRGYLRMMTFNRPDAMNAANVSMLQLHGQLLQEFVDAVISNIFQVLNHAHSEMCSVSFIEVLKPFAGKIFTLVAVSNLMRQK